MVQRVIILTAPSLLTVCSMTQIKAKQEMNGTRKMNNNHQKSGRTQKPSRIIMTLLFVNWKCNDFSYTHKSQVHIQWCWTFYSRATVGNGLFIISTNAIRSRTPYFLNEKKKTHTQTHKEIINFWFAEVICHFSRWLLWKDSKFRAIFSARFAPNVILEFKYNG